MVVVVVVGQLLPARRPQEPRRGGVPCRTGSLWQGRKRSGRKQRTDTTCEITKVYSSKSKPHGQQKSDWDMTADGCLEANRGR